MNTILLYVFFAIEVVLGVSSSLSILIGLPVVFIKKVINKIRTGASLYD